MIRHERQIRIRLQSAADFDAVDLRHHDVEQNEIGMVLPGHRQGFLAVSCFHKLVALRPQPRQQNVAIGLIVIDDENARRIVHRKGPALG